MFNLDQDIPEPLRPLAWLIGRWEGAGVVGYPTIESAHFGQEIEVTHDGRGFLKWESKAWILDSENGAKVRPAAVESGFWRPLENGEVELLLAHPTGIVELYYGKMEPAKVELRTDGVLRSPGAKEYNAKFHASFTANGVEWMLRSENPADYAAGSVRKAPVRRAA